MIGRARRVVLLFCALFLLPFGLHNCWSQISTATISGTVSDNSGAVVPAATVTAVNEGTNATIVTQSNAEGTFVAGGLPVGVYTITVAKDGFQSYTQKGIETHPAQVTSVNLVLSLGAVSTHVQVTASAVQVQTTTPEVSSEVSSKEVGTLPLNGRNFQSLSALMPGVTNTSPDTAQVQGGFIQTNTMSINGMGITGSGYYLDGVWDIASGNMDSLGITRIRIRFRRCVSCKITTAPSTRCTVRQRLFCRPRAAPRNFMAPRSNTCAMMRWMPATSSVPRSRR